MKHLLLSLIFLVACDTSVFNASQRPTSIILHADCDLQYFDVTVEVNFDTVAWTMDTLLVLHSPADSIEIPYNERFVHLTITINGVGINVYRRRYRIIARRRNIIKVYNYKKVGNNNE